MAIAQQEIPDAQLLLDRLKGAREARIAPLEDAELRQQQQARIDDVAVEEGTFSGTHKGVLRTPTGDVPPTGRPVSIPYVHVLRYRGGKHVSFNLTFDRLLMLEQLGLVPSPAVPASS